MAFVDRVNGIIVGSYALPQYEGQEEVSDDSPELLVLKSPKPSLHDRLKAILLQLPDEVQAQFGVEAAAVDLAIQNGSPNVAKLELQALTLPPELEAVRTALITEIDNG